MRTRDLKRKLRKNMFNSPRSMTYDKEHRTYRVEICGLVDKTFKKKQEAVDYVKSLDWRIVSAYPERLDDKTVYHLLPHDFTIYKWAEACIDRVIPLVSNPEMLKKHILVRK